MLRVDSPFVFFQCGVNLIYVKGKSKFGRCNYYNRQTFYVKTMFSGKMFSF